MAATLDALVAAKVAARWPDGARLCAAFSGGMDSVVLLDILAGLRRRMRLELSAVHVHHGLSPNADRWAGFCEAFCRERSVPLQVVRVKVARRSRVGLEAAAREKRYDVFRAQAAEAVVLAHHLDDQAHTALLQLLRGSGLKGLAAMPEWRPTTPGAPAIFRPLLEASREDLKARARDLAWVEDESNASTDFDRNRLRLGLAPLLDRDFPGWRERLARFSRHAAQAEALLAALAREDGVPVEPGEPLALGKLHDPARRANALRAFLAMNALAMPTEARLAEMSRQLYEARGDARVRLAHAGIALVRHRGEVRIDRGAADRVPWTLAWKGADEVPLGPGRGVVRFARAEGSGIAGSLAGARGWHFASRTGGERIRLGERRSTRTLKNLLREAGCPAWERERLPMLFHGPELVWVPHVGIARDYQCRPGEPGLVPEWIPGPPKVPPEGALC